MPARGRSFVSQAATGLAARALDAASATADLLAGALGRWARARKAWALVPLRLVVGFGFAAHGYAKLARGPESFAAILQAIGVPAPLLMAWTTSLLELLGGISLILGAYVLPLSLPLSVVMVTAMFGVHFRYGFSSIRLQAFSASGAVFGPIGYELNLLYVAALLVLALCGPSPASVDRWLYERKGEGALLDRA